MNKTPLTQLIPLALYGWQQVQQVVPLSREYWRQLRHAGKAPQPIYVAGKALWRGQDLIEWLRSPNEYRVELASEQVLDPGMSAQQVTPFMSQRRIREARSNKAAGRPQAAYKAKSTAAAT